jgi:hypothetical protein
MNMQYLDFVVTIVRTGMKLTKDQMKFAYTVAFKGMGMDAIEAAQMSLDLDTM